MYVDAMTLAAVADEWRRLLIGARIDTIIQPTEYALAFQCYALGGGESKGGNRWLYLSAHPQLARAHITALKPEKIASEPPPFVMLLRKYLEGARIEEIRQPRWERVLEIVAGYRKIPESEERIRWHLILEIMGRLSNIILCDGDGMILGSLKRVGADINRYREVAAGLRYVPPPSQQRMLVGQTLPRLEPTTVIGAQLELAICGATDMHSVTETEQDQDLKKRRRVAEEPLLWQLLTKILLGCSPLVAREIVYRATEDAETRLAAVHEEVWDELAWNVRHLMGVYDTHQWQPQMIERATQGVGQGKSARTETLVPLAFAPYVLEQYAALPDSHVRRSPSMNVLLDDYFARSEWSDALKSLRSPLRKILQMQRERCKRKQELLQQEVEKSKEASQYRLSGDLLLAHQAEIVQGSKSVTVPNYFAASVAEGAEEEVPMVVIALDPRYDAVANSSRYFNKYHKLQRALKLVPEQMEQNNAELAMVEQLLTDLSLAETAAEVGIVREEIRAAGYLRGKEAQDKKALKSKKQGKGKQVKGRSVRPGGGVPLHIQSQEGFVILVGKNSRQNEEVTFHQASSNDIWLHARGVAGAHVLIKGAGRQIPRSVIEQAASLAAYYSEARGMTSVPVDYTLQRHVRHMKNGGPGMVVYDREQTVYTEPNIL
jgi:predicted ribosome quality control (RQC) complex YloA/Tae2 family protein